MVVWSVPKIGTACWKFRDPFWTVPDRSQTENGPCEPWMCVINCGWSVWGRNGVSFRSSGVGPNAEIFGQFRTAHVLFEDC